MIHCTAAGLDEPRGQGGEEHDTYDMFGRGTRLSAEAWGKGGALSSYVQGQTNVSSQELMRIGSAYQKT